MSKKVIVDLGSSFEFERLLNKTKLISKKDVIRNNQKYIEYTLTD